MNTREDIIMHKKPIFWLGGIALVICIVIAAIIWLHPSEKDEILKVVTIDKGLEETECEYWSVYRLERAKKIDAFEPEEANFYYVDVASTFHCEVRRLINHTTIVNEYIKPVIRDEAGKEIEANEDMIHMLQYAAKKINHDIWSYTMIEIDGRYFAHIELNAGLFDHGDLYEYRKDTKKLHHIVELDGKEIVGISLEGI